MSMKTILAPVMGNATDKTVLEAAGTLAAKRKSHVMVLFSHRDPRQVMLGQVGEGMTASMLDALMESAEAQMADARAHARATYDAWLKDSGIAEADAPGAGLSASWAEEIGDPETVIARKSRLCDVTCAVQPGENDPADLQTVLEAALLQSGKAVLMVSSAVPLPAVDKVAVAWNGSREAARAVALAMPLMEAVGKVVVLSGTSSSLTGEDVDAFVQSLRWQGIEATAETFDVGSGSLSGRLQASAREQGAQILVLGAYSHSRLRELVFGGVTDDILLAARLPILMAH